MTEGEARTKWCPMGRVLMESKNGAGVSFVAINQGQETPGAGVKGPMCFGSGCMMWRWIGEYKATKAGPIWQGDSAHGYCGLAGKPNG